MSTSRGKLGAFSTKGDVESRKPFQIIKIIKTIDGKVGENSDVQIEPQVNEMGDFI